jgi:hypothetical protein
MMDRSAVKAIVDREIEPLMKRLGIPHWRIVVGYEPESTDDPDRYCRGRNFRLVDYNRARVVLNPEGCDTEEEVLETLRHELEHVVISPFDVYLNAVTAAIPKDSPLAEVLESVWIHAMEQTVVNLNRMYLGLTGGDDGP